LKCIDENLRKIKFPKNSAKYTQQSISEILNYKASEYRNLVYYSFVYILKPYMREIYYNHLLKFLLFMRILSQKKIVHEDIKLVLIHEYLQDYEEHYGAINSTYNIHIHLHFPLLVSKFGPLQMLTAFAFEGYFFLCKKKFHGTRNIIGQIANNMVFKQKLYFENNDLQSNILENKIKGPKEKKELFYAIEAIRNYFKNLGVSENSKIEIGYSAIIGNIGKFLKSFKNLVYFVIIIYNF